MRVAVAAVLRRGAGVGSGVLPGARLRCGLSGSRGYRTGGRRTSLPEQLGQTSAISRLHVVQNVHS